MSITRWTPTGVASTDVIVNTTKPGDQNLESVAALRDGGWVTTWQDNGGAKPIISYQVFNADGSARGPARTVAPDTVATNTSLVVWYGDRLPSVTGLDNGGFTISWSRSEEVDVAAPGFHNYIAVGQTLVELFDSTGMATGVGGQTLAANYFDNYEHNTPGLVQPPTTVASSVAALGNLTVFASVNHTDNHAEPDGYGIQWSLVDSNGNITANGQVNTTTLGNQTEPDVAALAGNTGFVITWDDEASHTVRGRVYNSAGVAQTDEITIGLTGTEANYYHLQTVAGLTNGNFAVAWYTNGDNNDGAGDAIKIRVFNAAGTPVSAELRVNAVTSGDQLTPDIVALKTGGFAVVFQDQQGDFADVKIDLFDASGNPVAGVSEFTVPTNAVAGQWSPSVTELVDGRIVVTWVESSSSAISDGSGTAVRQVVLDPRNGTTTVTGTSVYGSQPQWLEGIAGTNTTIIGGSGNDHLVGLDGNDTLRGLTGFNVLDGGAGSNTVDYGWTTAGVNVNLAAAQSFNLGGGAAQTFNDTLLHIANVIGGSGNDVIVSSGSAALGNSALSGGAGNDAFTITYSGGASAPAGSIPGSIDGGGGRDVVSIATTSAIGIPQLSHNADGSSTFSLAGYGLWNLTSVEFAKFNDATVALREPTRADFDGNGGSDMLWQNSDGSIVLWTMNGLSITGGGNVLNPGAQWKAVGTGDFNADGNSDILLQNTDGSIVEWMMNGNSVIGGGVLGVNPGSQWRLVGSGDFNGDGYGDMLLQNTNGSIVDWYMNGTGIIGGGQLAINPGSSWKLVCSGNFNGDGTSDMLFQNTDGSIVEWNVNGSNIIGGGAVINPGSAWKVVNSGDFNGDGKSDLILQNTDGSIVDWFMNGSNIIGGGQLAVNPGSSWHVMGTRDYNNDGFSDLLLQNDNGSVVEWFMNGTNIIGGGQVTTNPGSSWKANGN